jgi:hypothetical protein
MARRASDWRNGRIAANVTTQITQPRGWVQDRHSTDFKPAAIRFAHGWRTQRARKTVSLVSQRLWLSGQSVRYVPRTSRSKPGIGIICNLLIMFAVEWSRTTDLLITNQLFVTNPGVDFRLWTRRPKCLHLCKPRNKKAQTYWGARVFISWREDTAARASRATMRV